MRRSRTRGSHDRGITGRLRRSSSGDHLTDAAAVLRLSRDLDEMAARMAPGSRIAARFRESAAVLRGTLEVK